MNTTTSTLPRGLRINNPCNIRKGSPWKGLTSVQPDRAFCAFENLDYGFRAFFRLMLTYKKRGWLKNPETFVTHYAPLSDGNNVTAYIREVSQCWLSDIRKNQLFVTELAVSVSYVEQGVRIEDVYTHAYKGLMLAFGQGYSDLWDV